MRLRGNMGDSDLTLSGAYTKDAAWRRALPACQLPRLRVPKVGPALLAGSSEQLGRCSRPGGLRSARRTPVSLSGREARTGECVHEFSSRGNFGEYPDSDVARSAIFDSLASGNNTVLILNKKDLRHVIRRVWIFRAEGGKSGGMEFYMDDILLKVPRA